MRKHGLLTFWIVVILSVGGLLATILTHDTPVLGLDLRGGASVVLRPSKPVSSDIVDQAIGIIRNRVDALGVAEPNITRQGTSIVVELPGVKDTQRALSVVGQTAQLTFRPVLQNLPPTGPPPSTPANQVTNTATVVLPEKDSSGKVVARYQLGPVLLTGEIIKTATAVIDPNTGQWSVTFTTTSAGAPKLDQMATQEYQKQVAIVLDNVVKSAPTFQTNHFGGNGQITGSFTEQQAKDLALVLRFGALPVTLQKQTVQTVSATLGKDSLRAGIYAGIGGLILVLIYIVFYYRALGLVAVLGLATTGMMLWAIISYLGQTSGLALTLAGVIGIIVSIGITVDSYIVYFERLKDEIRSGKTIRSSVDRGFSRAFRTVLAADAVSFIGAFLLYVLTVGPVRGFAFFLGLSTLLDVFTTYFFTRPLVVAMGRMPFVTDAPVIGIASGLGGPRGSLA
ncbi:MAG TPA: protein translocase subunit SecD [Acidimicrobiales bacterium]|nr:protein translocase subunit SecD [Acidimicrobiales bacterium]